MSATDAAIKLVQEKLDETNAEIDKVAGPLIAERDELAAFLKKATRGAKNGSAPATSDEDLVAAVKHVSSNGPAKSPDIAKFLEVDPRTISRRLAKFATDGAIKGNKDDGYSA